MKKKAKNNIDVAQVMTQIQAQLATLDRKLDTFMTKSLTELAQALAAQKPAVPPRPAPSPQTSLARPPEPPRRQMYAVICYECGKDCEIPFKPSGGRPVYCQECFAKRKANIAAAKVNTMSKPQTAPVTAANTPEPMTKVKKKEPATKKPVVKKSVTKKSGAKKKAIAKKKTKKK